VWLGISKGEINGQAAFMSGKYRVEGDLRLLMKLGSLFGA
jgi:putative sterol carrier protein